MARIAIIDDDPLAAALATAALKDKTHAIVWYATGDDALRGCARDPADIVLVDSDIPGCPPNILISRLRQMQSRPAPIVVLTGFFDAGSAWAFHRVSRPDCVLEKPLSPISLRQTVASMLSRRNNPLARQEAIGSAVKRSVHSCTFPTPTLSIGV
ncbi:response regulator [Parerythrobacter aurantius]|uniref:response regulator n=1 Tax=Parerythrobacter aurantius TaxID=3127706 RepID=UPI003246B8CD